MNARSRYRLAGKSITCSNTGVVLSFRPLYDNLQISKEFTYLTPSAGIEMMVYPIDKADLFDVGKHYFLTITEAD